MINHQTTYQYALPCLGTWQNVHLQPQTTSAQKVLSWQIAANAPLLPYIDGFNNQSHLLTVNEPINQLIIMAQGSVELNMMMDGEVDDSLPPEVFLRSTEMTTIGDDLIHFLNPFKMDNILNDLIYLSEGILAQMPYTPSITDTTTTAEQAFHLKKGVCQDHTHVFVTLARYKGIPARYVSGYLYTADNMHLSSHAWAEAYINGKWFTFDISNQLFSPHSHVKLAVGRDFYETSPVRGVRKGGGEESMNIVVRVLKSV